ncbi:MAG: hypothetical protein CMF62_03890 [Magnetococcales bacterium]|nr:hypothetical protein [Magnetococcales bacterium]|tara:strand:- start:22216 stop:24501 length:2286 start_codon:yes stop_codon:yes gene_type:complete
MAVSDISLVSFETIRNDFATKDNIREKILYDRLEAYLNSSYDQFYNAIHILLTKNYINYVFLLTIIYKFEYYKKISKEQMFSLRRMISNYVIHHTITPDEIADPEVPKVVDLEDTVPKPRTFNSSPEHIEKLKDIIHCMYEKDITTDSQMKLYLREKSREHHIQPTGQELLYMMRCLSIRKEIEYKPEYEPLLRSRKFRSLSGVMVIAVFTSPYPITDGKIQQFSCEYDCYFCPAEPGQPRSYDPREPGNARARQNNYDPIGQFWDRGDSYFVNGHPVDKIELLVLGGTWSSYPEDYQETFIRDLYYAANTYYDPYRKFKPRIKGTLEEERNQNETSRCRIIGLTLETRPDKINKKTLRDFRRFGVTRLQLGVQHTDNRMLYRINRRHPIQSAIDALKMLKDCCFKVDIHLMPDLPAPLKHGVSNRKKEFTIDDIDQKFSVRDADYKMFNRVLSDPDLQADQWKVYPCSTIPYTRIYDDFQNGIYKPYGDSPDLFELLIYVMSNVHPWIRLNRVIRDIPGDIIIGGNSTTNLRQSLDKVLKERELFCKDIRYREVRAATFKEDEIKPMIRQYNSSDGIEFFITFETKDETNLLGFIRLRLSTSAGMIDNKLIFEDLKDCAMIRELHVYGQVVSVQDKKTFASQHVGLGRRLLAIAEQLAYAHSYKKIAVISGEGVRGYYRKNGYQNGDTFMVKNLSNNLFIIDPINKIHMLNYEMKKSEEIIPTPFKMNTPQINNPFIFITIIVGILIISTLSLLFSIDII